MRSSLALTASFVLLSNLGHAAVVANLVESGGDVRIHVSGSLDLTGWAKSADGATFDNFLVATGPGGITAVLNDKYDQFSAPDGTLSLFGTLPTMGVNITPISGPEGAWGYSLDNANDDDFVVPEDFTGGPIAASTFVVPGLSFAALGISQGDSWGANMGNGDTITFNAIPEPSSFLFLAGIFTAVSQWRRHRRVCG